MRPARRTTPARTKRRPPKTKVPATWCPNTGHKAAPHELQKLEGRIFGNRIKEEQKQVRKVQANTLIRCGSCSRRLHPKAVYCVGGEFTCFALPRHKTKVTRV